jgi:AcrR family transcriptional regulator
MARTRDRITQAAIGLHGSVGPAATTMSAVAERAGVTRATLYRHFPTEEALFAACSQDWLRANPRPDLSAWAAIADPRDRVRAALRAMYRYYRSTEAMLSNLYRDVGSMPAPIARNLVSYPDDMVRALDAGWPSGADARVRRAALRHAVAFETWRSLARSGLSDEESARLMTELVASAAASVGGLTAGRCRSGISSGR